MKTALFLISLTLVAGCLSKLDEYNAEWSYKAATKVKDEQGCFYVFPHPEGNLSVFVTECFWAELGQAVTESSVSGPTFGLAHPDFGAVPEKFRRAGLSTLSEGCELTFGDRIENVMGGGTAGYELFFECAEEPEESD